MKNKLKKIICSLCLAFALVVGSAMGLLSGLLNLKANAEYKPTSVPANPYDFSDSTGWSKYASNNSDFKNSFIASVSQKLTAIENTSYRPTTKYDGTLLTEDDNESSLVMIAKENTPVKATVDKTDDDGNYVYKKDGDSFVFEKEEGSTENKVYTDKANDNDYELVEGETNKYYKKIREQETKAAYFSYKVNSSLSLTANNWYVVTAYVFTKNAFATLTIGDRDEEFVAKATIEDTDGNWQLIQLFVEVPANGTTSAYISLYYGSAEGIIKNADSAADNATTTGAVIFDHIDVQKISQTEYNNRTIDGKRDTNAQISFASAREDYNLSSINGNFEDAIIPYSVKYSEDGYNENEANAKYQYYVPKYTSEKTETKLSEKQLKNYRDAYSKLTLSSQVLEKSEFESKEGENDGTDTFNSNNHILKLENKNEKYELGVVSPFITIKQFGFYRFSVYVKTTDANYKASVKLFSYIKTGNQDGSKYTDGAYQLVSQEVDAYTKDSDDTNNWTEVVFYIQGNSYHDSTIQVALLAGTDSTVYFDNMRLEAVSSSSYSNASDSNRFNLASSTLVMSEGITNGYFNYIQNSKTTKIEDLDKPYTPASWTKLDGNDKDVVSGVVSTKDTLFNAVKDKLGNPDSSPSNIATQNVLAIYSEPTKARTYGYKSSSFSLSSGYIYELTFYTYAEKSATDANFSGDVYVNLIFSDENIAEFKETVETNEGDVWVKHTIYVRTGTSSRTLSVELGVKDAKGLVYFRDFGYRRFEEKTIDGEKISVDEQFASKLKEYNTFEKQTNANVNFVDFMGNSSIMHSTDKVEGKDYFKSLYYELEEIKTGEKVQGEVGVVDTNSSLTLSTDPSYTLDSTFLKRTDATTDFALMIYNKVNGATTINPVSTISLSSSSYYQISFYVKTDKIEEGKGLSAIMDAISVRFENINNSEYTKFTVLVKTGTSSISNFKINFMLGDTDKELSGLALISDIEIKKFENETAYQEVVDAVAENDKNTVIKDFSASSDDDDSTNESADNLILATFFLVFSSILLVVALVIAVISISLKKVPKAKNVVGSNNANVSNDKSSDTSSKDGFV